MKVLNPVIWSDVPDVDVIRVGEYYYMVSTTMYFNPGVPVMRSKDMLSWEIINYVYDTVADGDKQNLRGSSHAYGNGSWAASIRYNNGKFYVFFDCNDTKKSYVYRTRDIENGPWTRTVIDGIYHDASMLFDDDGRVYLVYGASTIRIKEMTPDADGFLEGGLDKVLFVSKYDGLGGEGSHIMKINGKYYVFIISWPRGQRRIELCFRCDTIDGEYECKLVHNSGLNGYDAGVAQGCIVSTPDGGWKGILFQDHGAVGRIPMILDVNWVDGWPIMSLPQYFETDTYTKTRLVISDEFDYTKNKLALQWQWNHNPENSEWSVTERKGYLRLYSCRLASNLIEAKNTLTQRTEGPKCTAEIKLDLSHMKKGDFAGLAAFQEVYGQVGVYVGDDNKRKVFMASNGGHRETKIEEESPYNYNEIYLRVNYNFSDIDKNYRITDNDTVNFEYSSDCITWHSIGIAVKMKYLLSLFTGYRSAIYNYSTLETGGYVDVDYFRETHVEYQPETKQ